MTEASEDGATFEVLANLPAPQGYTDQDRYRDFRRVFLGSEEGKRVLREVLSWCRLFKPSISGVPIDPYATHVRDAERNMGLRLITTITVEPGEKPTQTMRKT